MNKLKNIATFLILLAAFGAMGMWLVRSFATFAANLTYSTFLLTAVVSLLVTFAFKVNDAVKNASLSTSALMRVRRVAHHVMARVWALIFFAIIAAVAVVATKLTCDAPTTTMCEWVASSAFAMLCTATVYGIVVPALLFFDLRRFEQAMDDEKRRRDTASKLRSA